MKNTKEFQNEQVIYECKTHWMALLVPGIIGVLFFFASLTYFVEAITGEMEDGTMAGIGALFTFAVVFGVPFLRIKTNKLVLTDKRIYGKTGIIKTKSLTAPISKIQTVNIDKKLLGRIFGYADITIHCITGVYIFKKQSNAEEMQNAILNMVK